MGKKETRGRPENPAGVTRAGVLLTIRCSREEKADWQAIAELDGITLTELIRRLLVKHSQGITRRRK